MQPGHRSPPSPPVLASLRRYLPALLGAAVLIGAWGPNNASAAAERGPARSGRLPAAQAAEASSASVIVKFKAGSRAILSARAGGEAQPLRQASALGARHHLALRDGVMVGPRLQLIHASGLSSQALASRLSSDSEVEYAVPNGLKRAHAAPSDPAYAGGGSISPAAGQWYLRTPDSNFVASINAEAAWSRSRGSAEVVVAVLDTGVRANHPDLVGKLLPGYDFVADTTISNDGDGRDGNPADPGDWITSAESLAGPSKLRGCEVSDSSWHGTQTAGLVGAATNNGVGIAGIGRHVRVLPVRVLGKCVGDDADILAGMYWAAGIHVAGVADNPNPASVISMSLGSAGACDRAYQDAIDAVRAVGVTVVASAGNDSLAVNAPANCARVVAVAGLRHIGTKNGYSSLGSAVTISAPAGNCVNLTGDCLYPIMSSSNAGTTRPACPSYTSSGADYAVGTSFSTPLVAGTLALMKAANPALAPDQLTSLLRSSARAFPTTGAEGSVPSCTTPGLAEQDECYCTSTTCGAGMLDAGAAVQAAAAGRTVANLEEATSQVALGSSVGLFATNSQAATGQTLSGYAWSLLDPSLASFSGSTVASTATLTANTTGTALVRLSLTDSAGGSSSAVAPLRTGPAPEAVCVSDDSDPAPTPDTSSGGGGSVDGWLLAGMALALALLQPGWRGRRRG